MITAKFQDGDPVYRKAWQHIRKVSVEAVKENYRELGVHFDLWLGESDAHETCFAIKRIAEEKGLLEYDDGAYIIRLDEENKPKPPVIIEKSDGGFTYQATDIATIKMRVDDLHADEIIYFVDNGSRCISNRCLRLWKNWASHRGLNCSISVSAPLTAPTASLLKPVTAV